MTKRRATDLWDALDDATVDAELEKVLAMTPEERRRELVAGGLDLDQVRARADAVVASLSGAPTVPPLPAVAHSPAVAPLPTVAPLPAVAHSPPVALVPLRASRATRAPWKRLRPTVVVSLGVAAAAGFALVIATASAPSPRGGPIGVPSPTSTPASRVESLRRDAREACSKRSWQTCLDKLDEARTLDPKGDEAPAVQALRRSAGDVPPAP
jgi:hypothetical protein